MLHSAFRTSLPTLTVLLLTLISVLPLGAGDNAAFALPLLPLTAIHFWMLRPETTVPVWLVFLMGLAIDIATYGPLGYWSLLFLVGMAATAALEMLLGSRRWLMRWAMFSVTNAVVCVIAWGVASVFFGRTVESEPMLAASVALGLAYPFIALTLGVVGGWTDEPRPLNLERRA